MKIDKYTLFMLISAGFSLTTGAVLYAYSSGNWKNNTFETQAEASQAAQHWIKEGGMYIVKLHRSQLMEIPRNKNLVEREISELLEIEAGERKKCMKMLESIEGTDQYEACMENFSARNTPQIQLPRPKSKRLTSSSKRNAFGAIANL